MSAFSSPQLLLRIDPRERQESVPSPLGAWSGGASKWRVRMGKRKRLYVMAMAAWWVGVARAQDGNVLPTPAAPTEETHPVLRLPKVVVEGRQDSLIGVADSAGQGTTGATQLADRPILRGGEILETVPGVIITQHAGGGKANQYFLRGFNLDHGTDFAVCLDDMPLNLPSHGHGQGYTDMNIVIPELVRAGELCRRAFITRRIGDFSSAGAAHLEFYKSLPQSLAIVGGRHVWLRTRRLRRLAIVGHGILLYGGEAYHDDGPWKHPDDYQKVQRLLTYSQGDDANGFSITGARLSRQMGIRAIKSRRAPCTTSSPFFGSLDQTRPAAIRSVTACRANGIAPMQHSATKIMAYGFYYDLDLFSNFTYFLTDTNRGDQFEQADKRWVAGLDARHTFFNQWSGRAIDNTFGLQVRNDWIRNALYQTSDRVRMDKLDTNTDPAAVLPATTLKSRFTDTQAGFWAETKIQWAPTFRSILALRGDLEYFDVTCLNIPANSGTSLSLLPSPKLSLIFGPWTKTELYAQGGFGFHSNDGRGTTATLQPISAENPYGEPAESIPGLIQTKGAEIGVRTLAVVNLQSTLSLWYLHSDSELQQAGDTGGTVPSKQASNRWGIEWANYYTPFEHLALIWMSPTPSLASSPRIPRCGARQPGGTHVPGSVGRVIAAAATLHDWIGLSTSLRLRYFGPRD